jgi:hypothetical protein
MAWAVVILVPQVIGFLAGGMDRDAPWAPLIFAPVAAVMCFVALLLLPFNLYAHVGKSCGAFGALVILIALAIAVAHGIVAVTIQLVLLWRRRARATRPPSV